MHITILRKDIGDFHLWNADFRLTGMVISNGRTGDGFHSGILRIFTGYYVVQIICAVFVYGVGTFLPNALWVMKYIGVVYILWLAIHIAISKPEISEEQRSASFMKGFLLQFVNIKIYMFGITALTGFITSYSKALWVLIGFELLIATIGTIATSTWIGAGLLIQKFYVKHYRIINIILALTLLECIWSMLRA